MFHVYTDALGFSHIPEPGTKHSVTLSFLWLRRDRRRGGEGELARIGNMESQTTSGSLFLAWFDPKRVGPASPEKSGPGGRIEIERYRSLLSTFVFLEQVPPSKTWA